MTNIDLGYGAVTAGDLLQVLRSGKPRTRTELALVTRVSRSTAAQRVDDLISLQLVSSTGDAVSTGGRPSVRFSLRTDVWLIASIDLGPNNMVVGISNLLGEIITSENIPSAISEGPQASLNRAWLIVQKLFQNSAGPDARLRAIGIGLPGPVEFASGRPINPPLMPGWHNFDVRSYMFGLAAVPVLVDNDVNIAALGEQSRVWPNTANLLYIKVSTGIGAAVIQGSVLQRGAAGTAGSIGHIGIRERQDVLCNCGNYGCLEAVASVTSIISALQDTGLRVQTLEDITDLAQDGDTQLAGLLRNAGRTIGQVATTCIALINPEVIVIGGSLATANDELLAGIREVVYKRSTSLATRGLSIVTSQLGQDAALIGAAVLALDHVLSVAYIQELLEPLTPEYSPLSRSMVPAQDTSLDN